MQHPLKVELCTSLEEVSKHKIPCALPVNVCRIFVMVRQVYTHEFAGVSFSLQCNSSSFVCFSRRMECYHTTLSLSWYLQNQMALKALHFIFISNDKILLIFAEMAELYFPHKILVNLNFFTILNLDWTTLRIYFLSMLTELQKTTFNELNNTFLSVNTSCSLKCFAILGLRVGLLHKLT